MTNAISTFLTFPENHMGFENEVFFGNKKVLDILVFSLAMAIMFLENRGFLFLGCSALLVVSYSFFNLVAIH